MHRVVDISKWQGEIDWQAFAAERERHLTNNFAVIVRIGYGVKSTDPRAHYNLSMCKRLKIPVGMYWYAPEPLVSFAQIDNIVARCDRWSLLYTPEYPIYLDIEGKQQWGKKDRMAELCAYWRDKMLARKLYPGLYGSEKVLFANRSLPDNLPWWVARYSNEAPAISWGMWQYTNNGTAAGIGGRVDKSWCKVDYKKIIKEGGYNGH